MQNDPKCYLKLSDVHATSPQSVIECDDVGGVILV